MSYRLRTLLIVVSAIAIFFGGYRLGYKHGLDGRFDYLMNLMKTTSKPDSWDDVGSPGSLPLNDPGQLDPNDPFATPK